MGIGISIPGTVDSDAGIIKNCYLLGADDYNLKESFEEFNVPIFIDNEANLSAYYQFLNKKDILNNLLVNPFVFSLILIKSILSLLSNLYAINT